MKRVAAGQAVQLAGGGPVSGQRASGRTAAAAGDDDDDGGGGDGAAGKIPQLCACSGYSAIQKRKQIDLIIVQQKHFILCKFYAQNNSK